MGGAVLPPCGKIMLKHPILRLGLRQPWCYVIDENERETMALLCGLNAARLIVDNKYSV